MSEAISYIELVKHCRQHPPVVALVLGSGLGELFRRLERPSSVFFADVPGMSQASVTGHVGRLTAAKWVGKRVLVFEGRLHYYEGHSWSTVLLPARIAHDLGARIFLASNAAGGIRDDLGPGSLMALTGHLDWTQPRLAKVVADPYSYRLNFLLQQAAADRSIPLVDGVYAQVTGPCYETPAEIRGLRSLRADAVGMSTGREIVAARELGLECAAISCIANRAAGLSQGPIQHTEVLTSMAAMCDRLGNLLERFLERV